MIFWGPAYFQGSLGSVLHKDTMDVDGPWVFQPPPSYTEHYETQVWKRMKKLSRKTSYLFVAKKQQKSPTQIMGYGIFTPFQVAKRDFFQQNVCRPESMHRGGDSSKVGRLHLVLLGEAPCVVNMCEKIVFLRVEKG